MCELQSTQATEANAVLLRSQTGRLDLKSLNGLGASDYDVKLMAEAT
jgi:hypothetical protein